MTTSIPAVRRRRDTVYSILRVLCGGLLLSVLVAGSLYVHHTAVPFLQDRLLATDKKTTAWFVEQLGFSLPFIVICFFHTIVYRKSPRDGVAEREMMWQVILVTLFTYCIMLPYLNNLSHDMYAAAVEANAKIPETDGGIPWTLMMKLHDWFIRFSIPLALLWGFHGMRASRQRQFPCEDEDESFPTVEEYYARLAETTSFETESVETEA